MCRAREYGTCRERKGGAMTDETIKTGTPEDARAAGGPDSGPEARLSGKQMALLLELVGNPDVEQARSASGVSRATAYRWLNEPDFQEALTRRRNEVLAAALATVKSHAARAASQLAGLLETTDERLRRQVCNDLLAHALKVREMEDLESRLAALEKAMKVHEKNRRNG